MKGLVQKPGNGVNSLTLTISNKADVLSRYQFFFF